MSKQLNPNSGKGALLAAGQKAVLEYLETHTQAQAAKKWGFLKADGTGNGGSFGNCIADMGWIIRPGNLRSAKSENGDLKPAKRVKIQGYIPLKTSNWVIKVLGLDSDEIDEVTWEMFKQARDSDAEYWRFHQTKLKGAEPEELGKWITSNEAAEVAEAAAAKAAAETLKPKFIATLRKAHEMALEFDSELAASIHELLLKCVLND